MMVEFLPGFGLFGCGRSARRNLNMKPSEELIKRMIIDPAQAEANLLKAAIEYAEAIKAKQKDEPPFERRI